MDLAILFWFYKDFPVCRNHLELLRMYNPAIRIYGLYGGGASEAEEAKRQVGDLLDDLFIFAGSQDDQWKWLHGDLLIADWHKHRGHALRWDTIVVVQWDMLVLGPISEVFGMLRRDEILLSGLCPVRDVRPWWQWANRPEYRTDFERFGEYLRERHRFAGEPLCCLFVVVCLSRRFLDRYAEADPPDIGFVEYRLPTLAQVLGASFCQDHPFKPWWAAHPWSRWVPTSRRILKATGSDVPAGVIAKAARQGRARVFHPFRSLIPPEIAAWAAQDCRRTAC